MPTPVLYVKPPVPFLLDFAHLGQTSLDDFIAFILGALLAVLVNAEAQAFMATILGDYRPEAKDRFNYNAFLHLDILGSVAFLLGGFGWPRQIVIDPSKFAHPRFYYILTQFVGPLANLLLAGIGGSIAGLMLQMEYDPRIFLGVIGVNVTVAVYNLIPIPPLALGSLWLTLLPQRPADLRKLLNLAGSMLIVALLFCDRIFELALFSRHLNPLVTAVFNFIIS